MKTSFTFILGFVAILFATAKSQFVSESEFSNAVTSNGYPRPSQSQYQSFHAGLRHGQISTKLEAAMALAQFLHESGGLKKVRENGCNGANGCAGRYLDWRGTEGCSKAGQSYYGRGYIQLTYCQNYRLASKALFGNEDRLRNNPDLVAQSEKLSWDVSFYFWSREVHGALSGGNRENFGVTTDKINGPRECHGNGGPAGRGLAESRFRKYVNVFRAFRLPGQPYPAGCY